LTAYQVSKGLRVSQKPVGLALNAPPKILQSQMPLSVQAQPLYETFKRALDLKPKISMVASDSDTASLARTNTRNLSIARPKVPSFGLSAPPT